MIIKIAKYVISVVNPPCTFYKFCGKRENLPKHLYDYITHKVCGCRQVFGETLIKMGNFYMPKYNFTN